MFKSRMNRAATRLGYAEGKHSTRNLMLLSGAHRCIYYIHIFLFKKVFCVFKEPGLWTGTLYFGGFCGPTAAGAAVERWGFAAAASAWAASFLVLAAMDAAEIAHLRNPTKV